MSFRYLRLFFLYSIIICSCTDSTGYKDQSLIKMQLYSVYPSNLQKVSLNASVILTFNAPIDESSVNSESIQIVDVDKNKLNTVMTVFENVIIIEPLPGFYMSEDTQYTIYIQSILNMYGNRLQTSKAVSFQTGSEIDNQAPCLQSVTAKEISSEVLLLFNEPVQSWNVTNNVIKLYDATNGLVIPVSLMKQNTLSELRFKSQRPLEVNRRYIVTINENSNIMDMAGNYYIDNGEDYEVFPEPYIDNDPPFLMSMNSYISEDHFLCNFCFSEPMHTHLNSIPVYVGSSSIEPTNGQSDPELLVDTNIEASWTRVNVLTVRIEKPLPLSGFYRIYFRKNDLLDLKGNLIVSDRPNQFQYFDYSESIGEVMYKGITIPSEL